MLDVFNWVFGIKLFSTAPNLCRSSVIRDGFSSRFDEFIVLKDGDLETPAYLNVKYIITQI